MSSKAEKGGGVFRGIKLLLCENPLPPIEEAIEAARAELPLSNYYTEPYSEPLRRLISERTGVLERLIHINAGSELILRQLFQRLGRQVHLLTPTYVLFPEIAQSYTETRLRPEADFRFDLSELEVPAGTSLAVIVNPNNPNGGTFDMAPLPGLLERYRDTYFLVDEAFIGMAGQSVALLVPRYPNLLVTRTLSKAHSLAGFRVGYAILPAALADDLNASNDAYPLARASQAAAIATLENEDKIRERAATLRVWARDLAGELEALGVRTFPSETYFFLADFTPEDAGEIAESLRQKDILIKPLNDPQLGPAYMRVTTATPEDNMRFVAALRELL
ncbi:pyridoxal phosphate-dependent aminotransferase [Methylocaldum gracile]|jgi:histidinol-phosphate aminotransferase|nr:histidinol-phosphate aminotransferase family protein [Methylocaldum sp.]MVF23160.1 histidinol-phosphate aminotransferase family protein [Methylocaldum sp. BRCS4]